MTEDYLAKAERAMWSGDDPLHKVFEKAIDKFRDNIIRDLKTIETQHAIIKYAEAMAQVLAQAAMASQKAGQGSADYALDRWLDVIRTRATELIHAAKANPDAQQRMPQLTDRTEEPTK